MQTNDKENLVWVIRHITRGYLSFAKFSKGKTHLELMNFEGLTQDFEKATQFRTEALADFYHQNKMHYEPGEKLSTYEWFVEGWAL